MPQHSQLSKILGINMFTSSSNKISHMDYMEWSLSLTEGTSQYEKRSLTTLSQQMGHRQSTLVVEWVLWLLTSALLSFFSEIIQWHHLQQRHETVVYFPLLKLHFNDYTKFKANLPGQYLLQYFDLLHTKFYMTLAITHFVKKFLSGNACFYNYSICKNVCISGLLDNSLTNLPTSYIIKVHWCHGLRHICKVLWKKSLFRNAVLKVFFVSILYDVSKPVSVNTTPPHRPNRRRWLPPPP